MCCSYHFQDASIILTSSLGAKSYFILFIIELEELKAQWEIVEGVFIAILSH